MQSAKEAIFGTHRSSYCGTKPKEVRGVVYHNTLSKLVLWYRPLKVHGSPQFFFQNPKDFTFFLPKGRAFFTYYCLQNVMVKRISVILNFSVERLDKRFSGQNRDVLVWQSHTKTIWCETLFGEVPHDLQLLYLMTLFSLNTELFELSTSYFYEIDLHLTPQPENCSCSTETFELSSAILLSVEVEKLLNEGKSLLSTSFKIPTQDYKDFTINFHEFNLTLLSSY